MYQILNKKKYNIFDLISISFKCSPISSLLIGVLFVLEAVTPTLQILATANFIDKAIEVVNGSGSIRVIYVPIAYVVGLLAFSWLFRQFNTFAKSKLTLNIKEKFRYEITKKRASLKYRHIEDPETWDVILRVSKDPENIIAGGYETILTFFGIILKVSGIVLVISVYVWWIGLFIIIFSVPIILTSIKSGKRIYSVDKENSKYVRKYNYLVDLLNSRDSIEERSLFRYTDKLNKMYEENYDIALKKRVKVARTQMAKRKGSSLMLHVVAFFISLSLIPATVDGVITIGLFISIFKSISELGNVFGWPLSFSSYDLAMKMEYFLDLNKFVSLEEVEGVLHSPSEQIPSKVDLEFKNVSFKYPKTDKIILDNLSFKIENGKHYAFVGANGAGKTTITKLITGLYDNYEGSIFLNGKELKEYDQDELNACFSVLFQDFVKYEMSFEDNVYIGNVNERNKEKFEEVTKLMSLDKVIDKLPNKEKTTLGKIKEDGQDLSGGQWQRVAMARALYDDSSLRILDEPTASLDPISESLLYEDFEKMSGGKTTIFISHRLGSTKLADTIFVIDNGTVVEAGSHKDLIKKESLYKKMYESQKEWYSESV